MMIKSSGEIEVCTNIVHDTWHKFECRYHPIKFWFLGYPR